jgi:hypothetical protein
MSMENIKVQKDAEVYVSMADRRLNARSSAEAAVYVSREEKNLRSAGGRSICEHGRREE